MKRYDYQLCDDGGVSTAWEQEILVPIGTKFLHEFGLYIVDGYMTEQGINTMKKENISQVICNRIKTIPEIERSIKSKKS